MTARQLEELMRRRFGDDFRDKAIVNALGSFRLADVFEECGLRDPRARPESWAAPQGAFQIMSYGGTYSMSRVNILSRHLTRQGARKREAQLEAWQRIVTAWLAEGQPLVQVQEVNQAGTLAGLHDEDVTSATGVPVSVLRAAKKLVEAGTWHTDHVQVEPRRRRFRWVVTAKPGRAG